MKALAGILLSLAGGLSGMDFNPGSRSSFPWPDFEKPITLAIPRNYDPAQAWPVIFDYHTKGMEPNVLIPDYYTDSRDFILIGMPYVEEDIFSRDEAFFRDRFEILRQVRAHLKAEGLKVDETRTYLGGLGMGGWYASYFADLFMPELSGVYIIGAGVFPGSKISPRLVPGRKPVYLGVGQLESNYDFAVNAQEHFRRLGATVTFDEFIGEPHRIPIPPNQSERLRQWFAIEANRPNPEAGKAMIAKWLSAVEVNLGGLREPLDQYLFIEHLPTFPFFQGLSAETRLGFKTRLETLAKNPALATELAARKSYLGLHHAEVNDFSSRDRRRIAHEFAAVWKKYPDTFYGRRAGISVMRLRDAVENPDRREFLSEEDRQKFIREAAERPLPEMPDDNLIREMQRVAKIVYLN